MMKGPGSADDQWDISVVICDIHIPQQLIKSMWRPKNFRSDDFNLTKMNSCLTCSHHFESFINCSVQKEMEMVLICTVDM